jgi:hypothetical protein
MLFIGAREENQLMSSLEEDKLPTTIQEINHPRVVWETDKRNSVIYVKPFI